MNMQTAMVKRLRFLAAWLPMRRGLRNIQSDWRAWDFSWNAGLRRRLLGGGRSAERPGVPDANLIRG